MPGHCCQGLATYPGASSGPPSNAPLFGLAPDGVCHASPVTRTAVSSYLAFSPLPLDKLGAVCFLWHFPWGHPRSPLATTLPCGARTFLPSEAGDHPTPFRKLSCLLVILLIDRLVGQLIGPAIFFPGYRKDTISGEVIQDLLSFLV